MTRNKAVLAIITLAASLECLTPAYANEPPEWYITVQNCGSSGCKTEPISPMPLFTSYNNCLSALAAYRNGLRIAYQFSMTPEIGKTIPDNYSCELTNLSKANGYR